MDIKYNLQINELEKVKVEYYKHIENEMLNLLNLVVQYSSKLTKMIE